MSEPYLIGQQQQGPPLLNLDVHASGGNIKVVTSLLGVDHREATLTPEVACQVMMNMGGAIEECRPGTLIAGLENWLAQLKANRAQGQKVLADLGMNR